MPRGSGGVVQRTAERPPDHRPRDGLPYEGWKFRRLWQSFAEMSRIPNNPWNMDARADRITDMIARGATLEDARKFGGHETASETARYSRDVNEAIDRLLTMRRNNRRP